MALIRQAEFARIAPDAITLDLGDLARQGEKLRQRARDEAERLVADGQSERAKLIAGAREQGFAQGLNEGRAQGLTQGRAEGKAQALAELKPRLDALATSFAEALTRFEGARETMLLEARREVLDLALLIAEKVVKRAIEARPELVADQLAAALAQVTSASALIVFVNPEDESLVRDALPALASRFPAAQHAELRTDAALARGSCVLRTRGQGEGAHAASGTIDASIATQLSRIVESLVGTPASQAQPREGAP
ncbi:MAG: FliH/SctL family protein [Planctomycetota bacterium]|nr:FliH/SctL family protein [Planctomycetota bacterium]